MPTVAAPAGAAEALGRPGAGVPGSDGVVAIVGAYCHLGQHAMAQAGCEPAARERTGVVTAASLRETSIEATLAADLLAEQATTLARLGNRLDLALVRLVELAEAAERPGADRPALAAAHRVARTELTQLRWELLVVKEAMGLRGARAEIDRQWPVPPALRTEG